MPILDFKELSTSRASSVAGEDFDGLVREIGKRLGLAPEWAGRGADGGRDLFFTERRKGVIGSYDVRWLVSCKDFANSGRSVSEGDVGSVSDKVVQHGANGFLLATTTTASGGLKAMLDGLNAKGSFETKVWDKHELENMLLQKSFLDLVQRHLPVSYATYTRPKGLSQVLAAFEALVPGTIYEKVREVVSTFEVNGAWLTGDRIWPHDRASADTIDRAVSALLERGQPEQAARALADGEIEFDAFEAALESLGSFRPVQAQELARELVRLGDVAGYSLNAYRFYVERYGIDNGDQISLATNLSVDDLQHLFEEEVASFIDDEITTGGSRHRGGDDLDVLSSHTTIEEVYADEISFIPDPESGRISFNVKVSVSVSLEYDREVSENSTSFPGTVGGYIDEDGMHIDEFEVNTDSFYA